MESFLRAWRIPAFAYSLVALLFVGVISYYMFRHEDIAPNQEFKEGAPSDIGKDTRPPVVQQGEAEKKKRDDVVSGSGTSGGLKTSTNQPGTASQPGENRVNPPDIPNAAAPTLQSVQSQNAAKPFEAQHERTSDQPVPSSSQDMNAIQESRATAGEKSLDGKATTNEALEAKMKSVNRTPLENMRSLSAPRIMESAGTLVDSSALADSARMDSLRRVEKELRLRRGKVKKPGE